MRREQQFVQTPTRVGKLCSHLPSLGTGNLRVSLAFLSNLALSGLDGVSFGSLADISTAIAMSALPPKPDICSALADVRFGPIANMLAYSITSSARPAVFRMSAKDTFGGVD
jgi:hypothetical protein